MTIRPIILCGGSGSRLWPDSRRKYPKQFVKLFGNKSLLELTLERIQNKKIFKNPIIITSLEYKFYVIDTIQSKNLDVSLILEPIPRGTTAAIYFSALICDKDEEMLIMPSDHLISNNSLFSREVRKTAHEKSDDKWITFGTKPNFPSTGYGYIKGANVESTKTKNLLKVTSFVEKPKINEAKNLIEKGYLWNSGIFMGKAWMIIKSIQKHAPNVSKTCDKIKKNTNFNSKNLELDFDYHKFSKIPSISIDFAVMEKANNILLKKLSSDWSDVGSWDNLIKVKNTAKNSKNIIQLNSKNNYIRNKKRIIATIGIQDTIIVDNDDATLIIKKGMSEKVGEIVKKLEEKDIKEGFENNFEIRPWGKFETLLDSNKCKIKRIIIDSKKRLSLQYHNYRSEHWLIVSGKAKVFLNGKTFFLKPNESIDIPVKGKHYLENMLKKPLVIIETQLGSYFGEDDIIRIEDPYERN